MAPPRRSHRITQTRIGATNSISINYAEMAALICPRPFMAERFPETDPVSRRTLAEFARARLLYENLGLADRVAVATFTNYLPQTPYQHRKTFDFLHCNLRWPQK
jgi:hypothetical protein